MADDIGRFRTPTGVRVQMSKTAAARVGYKAVGGRPAKTETRPKGKSKSAEKNE